MDYFLGQLALFPWGTIPKNWAPCQGQLLQISQNQALFALLGTTFGGDGRATFGLPDLRGRTPIMSSPTYPLGTKAGEEFHQLTSQEVPPHTHALMATTSAAQPTPPRITNSLLGTSNPSVYAQSMPPQNNALVSTTLANYGGNQGHENRSPFLAMNWCIALTGIFPSFN
ncbi:MAG: tail fiber protein [Candidatus Acidiferrales bacterium]|jgi:microcystin-dependent protein